VFEVLLGNLLFYVFVIEFDQLEVDFVGFLQQKRPLNAILCLLMVGVEMSTLGIIFFFCWLYLFKACTCCLFM